MYKELRDECSFMQEDSKRFTLNIS